MSRLYSLGTWWFSSLAIALAVLVPLTVPEEALADAGSDCGSQCSSQCSGDGTFYEKCMGLCTQSCCYNSCGGDGSCVNTCCQEACGGDSTCLAACMSSFGFSSSCPNPTNNNCFANNNTNAQTCAGIGCSNGTASCWCVYSGVQGSGTCSCP
jgi:hypothetical protein